MKEDVVSECAAKQPSGAGPRFRTYARVCHILAWSLGDFRYSNEKDLSHTGEYGIVDYRGGVRRYPPLHVWRERFIFGLRWLVQLNDKLFFIIFLSPIVFEAADNFRNIVFADNVLMICFLAFMDTTLTMIFTGFIM